MSDQTHNYSECRCHDCTTARYRTSFQFQIDSALRPAATESKAEGGNALERQFRNVENSPYLCLRCENFFGMGGHTCKYGTTPAEPPQPSVQRCADNDPNEDCKGGGQRGKPSCMFPEPSVPGEQESRVWPYCEHGNSMSWHAAGKCDGSVCKCVCHKVGLLGFYCCPCSRDEIEKIVERGQYTGTQAIPEISNPPAAPSITSERIAEIANEPTPCSTYVSATKYHIEKALREAGVRVE